MKSITVPSGANVEIGIAGFQEVMSLKAAIAKELAKSGFKFDLTGISNKKVEDIDIDVGQIISAALLVDSSPEVNNAMLKCFARCTYNGEKIIAATFEPEAPRQDYYAIWGACLEANLRPFLSGLVSLLAIALAKLPKKQTGTESDQK